MNQLPVADALIIIPIHWLVIHIMNTLRMMVQIKPEKGFTTYRSEAYIDGSLRSEVSSFSAHQISSALSLCL